MGATICYSLQDDLSKNLIVARSTYTDDGSRPNTEWALDLILTDALIDPAVFVNDTPADHDDPDFADELTPAVQRLRQVEMHATGPTSRAG